MSLLDIYNNRNTPLTDEIGIWDQNWSQVFATARPLSCSVSEPSKNMEHPVETGAVITDHRIILPVEIKLQMIMPAVDKEEVYRAIWSSYLAGTLFTVYTRARSYFNMMIVDMPHEETVEQFDSLAMALSLKEVIFVSPFFEPLPPAKVKEKTNASTKEKGEVKPVEATAEQKTTLLDEATSKIGDLTGFHLG